MAHISETVEYNDFLPNTSYYNGFNLATFSRASSLAKSFRYYKPTKVTWVYEGIYNTFQESSATTPATPGLPYLYSVMNRTQNNHNYSLADLQAMGGKPRKLSGKITVSYKPNWCSSGLMIQGQTNNSIVGLRSMGQKAEWGWLQCPVDDTVTDGSTGPEPVIPTTITGTSFNPQTGLTPKMTGDMADQVLFNGHDIYIDQANGINVNRICRVSCTVQWSFKGANNQNNLAENQQILAAPVKITA